jgi:hypothetical protein
MDSTVSATNGDLMSRTARQLAPAPTLVALMLGAGPAMAAPFILPTGLGCPDFNLGIEATGGKLHTKIFVDENGNPVRILTAARASS